MLGGMKPRKSLETLLESRRESDARTQDAETPPGSDDQGASVQA